MVDPFLLAHAHASYISANQQAINLVNELLLSVENLLCTSSSRLLLCMYRLFK